MNHFGLYIYEFSGIGNFSNAFGWDHGISHNLGKETTLESANLCVDNAIKGGFSGWINILPSELELGFYEAFYNVHGGTRNSWGFVIASSREVANGILARDEENYPILEYEND